MAHLHSPANLKLLCDQAIELHQLGNLAAAESLYLQVLAAEPEYFTALHLLGVVRLQQGRNMDALQLIDAALAIEPKSAEAHSNYGIALNALGQSDEAVTCYNKALAIKPEFADALNNQGAALYRLKRFEEALSSYDNALAIKPNVAESLKNRGLVLFRLKRFHEALTSFDRALAINPEFADAHFDRGICSLLQGQFEEGWQSHEWRRKKHPEFFTQAGLQPEWSGAENIHDKTLLIHSEQGLGDTIQFVRYAALAQARGARVIVSAQPALMRLLKGLVPTVEIVSSEAKPPDCDYSIPLMSMPLAFKTNLENIPATIPYLRAEQERIVLWREQLCRKVFNIGICWQGRNQGLFDIDRNFKLRSFERIAKIPNVRLISLQKDDGIDQLRDLPPEMTIETLGADFDASRDAFIDSAAAMENLDLIITADTAIAHLAGSLGRPTWVALKYVPEWRWLLDRSDSPWYPTMQLFRQPSHDDWETVFIEMENRVAVLAASK